MSSKQDIPKVQAEHRDHVGSRHSIRLRRDGRLPAVIYGQKQDPLHISFDSKPMLGLLFAHSRVFEVAVNGETATCLVKDVQWDHLGANVLHLDLTRINLDERLTVQVSIELTGEAVGLKEAGAFISQLLNSIEIECLATQIPDTIKVDVSELEAEQTLSFDKVTLPPGVTCQQSPESPVASITITAPEEEEETGEEVEATEGEPEVIGKKEEDSEADEKKA